MATSNFPNQIDIIKRLQDYPQSQAINIARYNELRQKSSLTSAEQAELASLRSTIGAYLLGAEDWNQVAETLESIQEFFRDNVDGYIEDKQEEISTYAELKKDEFDAVLAQFTNKGLWSNLTTYSKWNTVLYNYETYMSLQNGNLNNAPVGDETDVWWQKLSLRGAQGASGIGISFVGTYDNARTYYENEAVFYSNSIYVCNNISSLGNLPTDTNYWSLFLSNSGVVVSSAAPASVYLGLVWIDTSASPSLYKYWDGIAWQIVGSQASKVSISDSGSIISATNVETALQEIVKNPSNVQKVLTATGTGTEIILATDKGNFLLSDGYSVTFKASANNSGSATTVNIDGKGVRSLYKPGTTTAPTLISGKYYTIVYSSSSNCFFIKASATGTATPAQVLAGVPFSNENDTDLVGTIPSKAAATYTPSTSNQTIAAGQYLSGTQTIAGDADLVAANIKSGKNIFGVAGSVVEATGNAVVGDVLAGKTFSKAGSAGLTGTMPNRGSQTTTLNITGASKPKKSISAGYVTASTITAQVDSSQASHIEEGYTLGGCEGTFKPGFIKNVQKGIRTFSSAQTSSNVTISAVNPDNCIVILHPVTDTGSYTQFRGNDTYSASFTNPTTLNLKRGRTGEETVVSWQVIEFNGVKSLQTGRLWVPANDPEDITISAVDTSKTFVYFLHEVSYDEYISLYLECRLTSSTNLRIETLTNMYVNYYVIESL